MQRPNKRPHDSDEAHDAAALVLYPTSSTSVARAEALSEPALTKRQKTSENTAVDRGPGHTFDRGIACDNARVQYGDTYNYSYTPVKGYEDDKFSKALAALRFPQMDVRRQTVRDAHADTCKWILGKSEYISWCDARQMPLHHGFLWIKSKPGAGKSTLVKFLLDETVQRSPEKSVISFFFNARGDALERSPEGMYRQLLHQMLTKVTRLQSIIRASDIADLEQLGWPRQMLESLFKNCVLSSGQEHITCFIDALDECPEEDIRELIDFLRDLGTSITAKNICFRVCLSSRHYPYVTLEKCQHLVLDGQEGHQQDISGYIRGKLRLRKSDTTDEIIDAVQRRAEGVFLWVVLVVRILNEENDRGNVHNLRSRLDTIPDGLENLFRDTLSKPSQDDAKLIRILQWMLFAQRPLTREELYFGVNTGGTHDGDLEPWDRNEIAPDVMDLFILNCSKGLAELTTDEHPTVQFIHESVRDYLFDGGFAPLEPEISKNLAGFSHEYLKLSCLRLISTRIFSDTVPEQAAGTLNDHFPLLRYAVDHVVHHAERACANEISQEEFVTSFPLLAWSRLSNLLGISSHMTTKTSLFVAYNAQNLLEVEDNLGTPLLTPAEHHRSIEFTLKWGNAQVMELLLKRGVVGDLSDADQLSLMTTAIEYAPSHMLKMLLGSGMRRSSVQSSKSLLSQASHTGDSALVRILLDHGARVDPSDPDTLYHAAEGGSVSIVKMLLDSGASVNVGENKVADEPIVSLGKEHGIACPVPEHDVNEGTEGYEPLTATLSTKQAKNMIALQRAVWNGDRKTVHLLLEHGADLHVVPEGMSTPLHLAASRGNLRLVRILLEHGADQSVVLPSHCTASTPVYYAALNGHHLTLALFLETEVWRRAPDSAVWHESLRVAAWNAYSETVKVLIANSTGVHVREHDYYRSIIQAAAVGGREEILKLLLDDDTHFRAQSPEGYSNALRQAMNLGNDAVVEILRERGVRLAENELIRLGTVAEGAYLARLSGVRQSGQVPKLTR
jgi:ankyrin repeat protein